MKLLVTTDAHLYRSKDNKVWCKSIYGYKFWERYLEVYDEVRVVARLKEVERAEDNWLRVDGEGLEIYGIPFFQGPTQLFKNYLKIKKSLKNVYKGCDVALYRLPSPTGQLVYREKKNDIPTAAEIVFDPTGSLESTSKNLLRKYINRVTINDLKKICLEVNGVSYVTEKTIQNNFPSNARLYGENNSYFESHYSSINLNEESFISPIPYKMKGNFTIAHSNVSMNSNRKGEMKLLEAIKIVRDQGYKVNGIFIGDGLMKGEFEKKASDLNITEFIQFTGLLSSSQDVRKALIKSDLYVLPTQAEGLPRGILEAMAVGLPCISSPVGGIPEILPEDCLANPNDPKDIAEKIINLISSEEVMEKNSVNNYRKAMQYRNEILQNRRNEFYEKLTKLVK